MGTADLDLVRRMNVRWLELVEAQDIDGVQEFAEEFIAPDAWIDFGSRAIEALPGRGRQIVVDWVQAMFAEWREQRVKVLYELGEPEQVGNAILVRGRSHARVYGMDLDIRWTYRFVVRDQLVVSVSMHDSYDEAAAPREDD